LHDDVIDDTYEILIDRLNAEIESQLLTADRDLYLELLDTNPTMDQAFGFAKMKINNFDGFIKSKLEEFRKEYLEQMAK